MVCVVIFEVSNLSQVAACQKAKVAPMYTIAYRIANTGCLPLPFASNPSRAQDTLLEGRAGDLIFCVKSGAQGVGQRSFGRIKCVECFDVAHQGRGEAGFFQDAPLAGAHTQKHHLPALALSAQRQQVQRPRARAVDII